jgi:hypothetical protein
MSKLITFVFEAICIAMMFLFIVGIAWGGGSAILEAILMGVRK